MDANRKGVFTPQEYMRLTGCIVIATFLAQAVFQQKQNRVHQRDGDLVRFNGWFYNTRDQWTQQTGLSRYQQERARKWLKDHGLLSEQYQRLNVGVIVWYRIHRDKLNRLINGLAGESTFNMDGQSSPIKEEAPSSFITDLSIKIVKPYHSKAITLLKTIVLKQALKALNKYSKRVNGTNVSDKNTQQEDKSSVNHCLTKKIQKTATHTAGKAPTHPTTPTIPSDSVSRSDNFNNHYQAVMSEKPLHSFHADDYLDCHPFLFQWVKNVLTGACERPRSAADWRLRRDFNDFGFNAQRVRDSLEMFINTYGQSVRDYYAANTPTGDLNMGIVDLTVEHMEQAQACAAGQPYSTDIICFQETTTDVQKQGDS